MSGGDDFGISDDEEDRKPNVEYLDSLNDYRKRSRSRDDIGTSTPKLAKLNDNGFEATKINGNGHIPVSTTKLAPPAIVLEGGSLGDPTVFGLSYFC